MMKLLREIGDAYLASNPVGLGQVVKEAEGNSRKKR
jgi:hypothetical protein